MIVYETDDKKAYISALNPVSALEVIKSQELRKIAVEVSKKLKRVVEKVAKGLHCPGCGTINPKASSIGKEGMGGIWYRGRVCKMEGQI